MLRRLSVRGKILAALAVPVLVLFLAAAVISGQAIAAARTASQTSALTEVLAAQDAAGTEFAAERALAIMDSNRVEGANEQMLAQREKTDSALDRRDAALQGLDLSALDPRVATAVEQTLEDREALDELRRGIDRGSHGERQRTAQYTQLIDEALNVPRALADTSTDRTLAQYVDVYVTLDELLAQQALELPIVGGVITAAQAGQQNENDTQRAAILMTTGDSLADQARAELRALPDSGLALAPPDTLYSQVRANVSGSRPQSITPTAAADWESASTEDRAQTTPVRDEVRTETTNQASELASAATTRAVLTIIATVAAVVLSIIVAGLIARAIVNPLRRLTAAAEDVRDQLPRLVEQVAVPGQGPALDLAPITVESTDEVGHLATAFNDVNSTTVKVAREQAALRGSIAEMFVNVARRDQVLLNRQLAFLDDLERSEEDPGTLSNLFRLDHLATRMRRNAESLLVLAGIDSGRRVRQPMPASDVIRTASSEIELYDRVRLNLVVDPLMLGHNALNAAHLLAELLENATMFSEPHTPVEVTTGRDEHAVHVVVRDHGLGMTPEEIADANRKVTSHAASDVVGAQRLGLFVVGRLADRLGAKVRYASAPDDNGTEVTVSFPAVLFVPDSNVPLPQPTDPLESSTQVAAQQFTGTAALPAVAPEQSTWAPSAPVSTASQAVVEPEAPEAVPVDLAALTDGTTQTGMPRRRSRTVDPAASAPSASLASGPQTGAIVLPPLATPALPDELPAGDEAWTPPAEVAQGRALPSRSRAAATPVEPTSAEIPVLDVSTRSALFSSFRPVGDRDGADNPVELQAAPEVTATDIPVVDTSTDSAQRVGDAVWTVPDVPQAQPWEPQAAPVPDAAWEPQPAASQEAWEPQPAASQEAWEPQPMGRSASEQPETVAATEGAWSPQFAPEPGTPLLGERADETRVVPAVPSSPAPDLVDDATVARAPIASRDAVPEVAPARDVAPAPADEVPTELTFEALPRFEELMADLPTRRSLRESQARKRGIFGRRSRSATARPETAARPVVPGADTGVERPTYAGAPSGPAPAGPVPAGAPAPTQAPPLTLTPAEPEPARGPVRASAFAAPAVEQPSVSSFAPAAGSSDGQSPADHVQPTAYAEPAGYAAEPAGYAAEPAGYAAEPAGFGAPTGYGAPSPAAPPAHEQTGADAGSYGAPTPLVRRQVPDALEPLDPGYISDSVEARSDWMASAVLYEEMSTLLRGSTEFQEETLADPNNGVYQPLKVESAADTGLTRRSRGGAGDGYVDRFTASIDRDPEQLRARLSAFQSATARGRVEGQDVTGSTWDTQNVDYVPDSAPQAR